MKKALCITFKVLLVLATLAGIAACIACYLKKAGITFKCCCDGDACLDDFCDDGEEIKTPKPETGE